MKPLYMWAGGKNKMIQKYLLDPGIPYTGYDTYVEPFFGGGAMMIHIAENNPSVTKFVLNDINPEIVGLYTAIKHDVNNFILYCDQLCNQYLPLSKEDRKVFFYKIRKEYTTDYKKWSSVQESATLYFLMKTAFNGIFQSTIEAKGRFCTPCGLLSHTDKVYDKDNVLEWNIFLQKVDIYTGNWEDCCDKVAGKALYFLDPPYRDSFTQYGQDFTDAKQLEVIQFCKKATVDGHLVMFCNRDTGDSFYTDNKGSLLISYYTVTYTAGRRATDKDGNRLAKAATEILLYSEDIVNMKCQRVIVDKKEKKKVKKENEYKTLFPCV
jgi:DNA adenine methylase